MFALVILWLLLCFVPVLSPSPTQRTPAWSGDLAEVRADASQDVSLARFWPSDPALEKVRWARIDRDSAQSTASTQSEEAVLSPYFFVLSDAAVDSFPLKHTAVRVRVSGAIADVLVSQTYQNLGKKPLECVYVFPASTRAAVYRMEMMVGWRRMVAQIARREDAREAYERAKREGRTASLLEQDRPNVFQIRVANILPGDLVQTDLYYTELLAPEEQTYQFVFPTVVGPRYSHKPRSGAPCCDRFVETPYLHAGQAAPSSLDIQVDISTAVPLWDLACPSHNIEAKFPTASRAVLRLASTEAQGGNRDFILRYRLTGQEVASGLMLHEGEDENFFLAMVQPPRRFAGAARPAMEYIFVVDVSGSMEGYPIGISKELLRSLLRALGPADRLNMILFSEGSWQLDERSEPATPANIQAAIELIENDWGGGGTEILPALRAAVAMPRPTTPMGRTIVIATDGYVDVEREAFDLISGELGNANFFTFGIGSSVNRHIIEGMARVGKGEPFVVDSEEEARAAARKFVDYIGAPVLTDVQFRFEGFDAYDVDPPQAPDLFAERPLIITGKWRGLAAGRIHLTGLSGGGKWSEVIDVGATQPSQAHAALRYIWARERIAALSDYSALSDESQERIDQITELGLRYSLMTKYTSFVAVDTVIRGNGTPTTVAQPLPLPQGVSDLAVVKMDATKFTMPAMEIPPPMDSYPPPPPPIAGPEVPAGAVGGIGPDGLVGGPPGGAPLPLPAMPPRIMRAPVRVGGSLQASRLLVRVEPRYPEPAKRARIQGLVLLRVRINEQGKVVEIHVVRGHPLLRHAAIDAVKQWKYRPTVLNGEPVAVFATVTVNFVLG